ncbi:CinA family protein [Spongisporangium articulatum]|uniref:CinA family protein n=1 Tax=Spongisporangium articulatum TaxID=3362603 RepID=A0ABW8AMP0_9ACTN
MVVPAGDLDPDAAAVRVVLLLGGRGETVACAESLTGGLVTSALVDVPGASTVLRGGVVAYATPLKHTLLGVDDALLTDRGAVDPDVALQMAAGVRERLGADWGCATTGVAGPDPQDGKPPGRVYVAVCGPDGGAGGKAVRELDLPGDRAAVRAASVDAVLGLLLAQVDVSAHSGAPRTPGTGPNG